MAFNIHKTFIDRITLECPMEERTEAINYLVKNGYRIIVSGSKQLDGCTFDEDVYFAVGNRTAIGTFS